MLDNKIEKLGRMVKTARKEQGLTQEQRTAVSGVGVRFIRELEQGKAPTVVAMLGLDITIGGGYAMSRTLDVYLHDRLAGGHRACLMISSSSLKPARGI